MTYRWRYNIAVCEDENHDDKLERGFRTLQALSWWKNVGSIPRCPACVCRHRKNVRRVLAREWARRNRGKMYEKNRERNRRYRADPEYRAGINADNRESYRADADERLFRQLGCALWKWRKNPSYGERIILGRKFSLEEAKREQKRLKKKRSDARLRIPGGLGPVARRLKPGSKV